MINLLNKFKSIIASEKANTLPEAIVTTIVSSIIMFGTAAILVSITALSTAAEAETIALSQNTNLQTRFQNDFRDGQLLNATAERVEFQFALVNSDNPADSVCFNSVWTLTDTEVEGVQTLTNSKTSYQNAECVGAGHTPAPMSQKVKDASFGTYTAGNRVLTITNGEAVHATVTDALPEYEGAEAQMKALNADATPQRVNLMTDTFIWEAQTNTHVIPRA